MLRSYKKCSITYENKSTLYLITCLACFINILEIIDYMILFTRQTCYFPCYILPCNI